jgi:hypothetical protein
MDDSSVRTPPGVRSNWPALRRRRSPGERLAVWEALPKVELAFLVWGPAVPTWTHWTGLRTIGCVGRDCGCVWCPAQLPRPRWYVGAYALEHHPTEDWKPGRCAVSLTLAARRCCPDLRYPMFGLVGRRLLVGRRTHRASSESWARLSSVPSDSLPPDKWVDPRQVLLRLWSQGVDALAVEQIERLLDMAAELRVPGEGPP